MSTPVLALKHGQNHRRDLETMATRSNSGLPWRNSSSSFHGEPVTPGARIGTGQMSGPELEEFCEHMHAGRVEYVIFSYSTPIAYLVTGEPGHAAFWLITDTRYSNTTSQQVGRLYLLRQEKFGYHGPDAS
jgi:hypothetical protein